MSKLLSSKEPEVHLLPGRKVRFPSIRASPACRARCMVSTGCTPTSQCTASRIAWISAMRTNSTRLSKIDHPDLRLSIHLDCTQRSDDASAADTRALLHSWQFRRADYYP